MSRRQWLVLSGVAMVAFFIVLSVIERRLPEGSPSILEFEFVGNRARATEMIAEWGSDGVDYVRLSLWVDFGFMLSYGAFVTLAGLATRDFARERQFGALAAAGRFAPWCATAAALFDAGENTSLLLILGDHGASVAPTLATACASAKWALISLAVLYVAWGVLTWVWSAARAG